MNVLLISPPMQVHVAPSFPSFGVFYVAQAMKTKGHNVQIVDIDGNRYPKKEVSEIIKKSDCDIIAIGGLVSIYPYLAWLVPEIKRLKPNIEIVLGGAIASSLGKRCFDRFDVDYIVIGEGEITIVELLEEIKTTRNFSSVKGIGYRNGNGGVQFTEPRPLRDSLDDLPIFDDSLFPMENYLKQGTIQIHAQRGCPCSCTFCFNCFRVVSSKVRYRPVKDTVDEIEYFKNKYGDRISLFAISGESITMNKQWVIDFCKEILHRKLKIAYRVTSRVNSMDEERLKWLKKSGCIRVIFGLESGSQKILKIMKKAATVKQGLKAVRLTKKYIREIEASIIFGYIGEDRQTLTDTVRFCKEIKVRPTICYATPFPGTELYQMAVEKSRIKDEEKYMMGMATASAFDFDPSLNLTDMSDDEAREQMTLAFREIALYYFLRSPWQSFKMVSSNLKTVGVKNTASKIWSWVSNLKRKPVLVNN
ncbi:B12-binding domain-containing radical SAM protein [Candidatus Auribacterota bacterium]